VRSLFLSPHCDDEVLFGAFTLLNHCPEVIICCRSGGDYGSDEMRLRESQAAWRILGVTGQMAPDGLDLETYLNGVALFMSPDVVWAPSPHCSHVDHLKVSRAARAVFGPRVRTYETYVMIGDQPYRVGSGPKAPLSSPAWIGLKLLALAEFHSQYSHPRAHQFFLHDLHEYAEQP
jgi:LmbE family N-acetylglucosaminyl deacetylase